MKYRWMITALALMGAFSARAGAAMAPRLALHDCTVLDISVPARCGTFRVREDRAAQGGRELELNLVIVPAEGPTPAADPVFILAGGAGQVGMDLTSLAARPERVGVPGVGVPGPDVPGPDVPGADREPLGVDARCVAELTWPPFVVAGPADSPR